MTDAADNAKLTPTQRKILLLMRTHGPAHFAGGTRRFGWRVVENGVLIQAYQEPELFLARRGLIQKTPMNAPGQWYRLSPQGEERAARIYDPAAKESGCGRVYVPPVTPDEETIRAALRHAVDAADPALARYPADPAVVAGIQRAWRLRGWLWLGQVTAHGRAEAVRAMTGQ